MKSGTTMKTGRLTAVTTQNSPKRGRPRSLRPLVAFSISLPAELRRRIEEDAEREGRTLAGQIRHILQTHYKTS